MSKAVIVLKETPKGCDGCPCSHKFMGEDICNLGCGVNDAQGGRLDGCPIQDIPPENSRKRRIDDLGRVVIPKPFRVALDIKQDDMIEVTILGDGFFLRKVESEVVKDE